MDSSSSLYASSELSQEKTSEIYDSSRQLIKRFVSSSEFEERLRSKVDETLKETETKVFPSLRELATHIEVAVRRAVDMIIVEELKLIVLDKAKEIQRTDMGTSKEVTHSSSSSTHYIALPVAVLLGVGAVAVSPVLGIVTLVAGTVSALGALYSSSTVDFTLQNHMSIKEKLIESILNEVRASEILPPCKLDKVLHRTKVVYTIDQVFRMLCCKRWKLNSEALTSSVEDNITVYSCRILDVVHGKELPLKFRYSSARTLYDNLVTKYPQKSVLLAEFPGKVFQSHRADGLFKFFQIVQQDTILATSDEVLEFLGLQQSA